MNTDAQSVMALTEAAAYQATLLVLLAFQAIVPGSVLFLLWMIPVICYVAATRLPMTHYRLLILSLTGLSTVLYGVDTGLWTLFYSLCGGSSGWLHRHRVNAIIRWLSGAVVFVAGLAGIAWITLALAGLSPQTLYADLQPLMQPLVDTTGLSADVMLTGVIALLALLHSLLVIRFASRILTRLSDELDGASYVRAT